MDVVKEYQQLYEHVKYPAAVFGLGSVKRSSLMDRDGWAHVRFSGFKFSLFASIREDCNLTAGL